MPPLVLALIDSVLALAVHHDDRAKAGSKHALTSVRAEISGPETRGPAVGGLTVRVQVTKLPHDDASEGAPPETAAIDLHIDLHEQRLLARDLALAELPLDRSGLARVIGELEGWCYRQIPPASREAAELDG